MTNPLEAVQRGYTRASSWEEYVEETYSEGPPPFELRWGVGVGLEQVFDLLNIDKELIASALEGIDDVTSVLSSTLEVLDGVVEIIALALGAALDVFQGFIEALRVVLTSITNLVTGISISTLYHFPQTPKSRRDPDELIYDVGMAYIDEKDSKRPLTLSPNFGIALLAIWSVPNIEALLTVFSNLKSAFEKTLPSDNVGALNKYSKVSEVFNTQEILKGSEGAAPDFSHKLDLLRYGAIRDFVQLMGEAINGLSSKKSRTIALREIIELAQRRISLIVDKLQAVLEAINGIAQLFAFGDANSVLLLTGTGNSQDFSQAIINSVNHKDYPKGSLGDTSVEDPILDKGILSPSRTAIGRKSLYSGAFLLHAQMANPQADATNLIRIFNGLVNQVEQTTSEIDRQEQRISTNWDRVATFNQEENYNANGFEP